MDDSKYYATIRELLNALRYAEPSLNLNHEYQDVYGETVLRQERAKQPS